MMHKLTGLLVLGAAISSTLSASAGERLLGFRFRRVAAEVRVGEDRPLRLSQILPAPSLEGDYAPAPARLNPVPEPLPYGEPLPAPGYASPPPPSSGYGTPALPPAFGRAELPPGYGSHTLSPLGLPMIGGKPLLLGDGPCPCDLFARVEIEDLDHVHPCAVKQIVAVPDPCRPCDGCGPPKCVYVCICAPPQCPRVKVKGRHKIEYDYGDFEVEITAKRGIVFVDYDD